MSRLPVLGARVSRRVLLVHLERSGPTLPKIHLPAMGLLSIAAFLEARGHHVRVLHDGLRRAVDPAYELHRWVDRGAYEVVGLSLQWHQQAREVVAAAATLKALRPAPMIVLGGFTASVFADEILRDHPAVDFVIRGDAELPLSLLLDRPEEVSLIPNLVYRDGQGQIRRSTPRTQIDPQQALELDHTRFDLLEDRDRYLSARMEGPGEGASFSYSAGRGCEAACVYCGGGRGMQRRHQLRERTVLFPVEHVAEQLGRAASAGLTRWSTCFDPEPGGDYYQQLFRQLRAQQTRITAIFDCFTLPTETFIEEFAATFGPGSSLNLSPEVGSSSLRRRIRTWSYSNDELLGAIAMILARGLGCSIYFSSGFPWELRPEVTKTLALIDTIRRTYPQAQVYAGAIDLEPGSPLFQHQSKLGVRSNVHDFRGLLDAQMDDRTIHYRTDHLDQDEIEERIRLYRVAAACTEPQPLFSRVYSDLDHSPYPMTVARQACGPCPSFGRCYGSAPT